MPTEEAPSLVEDRMVGIQEVRESTTAAHVGKPGFWTLPVS